ncbi:MAG: hypothetical protein HY270_02365 [Deltaproteobacteria bacterium]|nr:hypothetical protein [Deltaproteobacteria bacterium]
MVSVGNGGIRRQSSVGGISYSVEGWFRPTGPAGARALIARVTRQNRWVQMVGIQGDGHFQHYVSDGTFERHVTSSSLAENDRIYHVVATAEAGGLFHLYINGREDADPQPAGTLATGDHWQIAVGHEPGWGSFQGTVDEIAFYDSVLTPEQVRQHYAAGLASEYASVALAHGAAPFYRLDEVGGSRAVDESPLGDDAQYDAIGITYRRPGLIFGDPDTAVGLSIFGSIRRKASSDSAEYTIEGWFKPSGMPGAQTLIARVDSGNQWVQLVGIQADGRFQHFTWDGVLQRNVDSSIVVNPGRVYHVAATAKNGGFMRLFVNGAEQGTPLRIGILAPGDHWQIGASAQSGWGNFDGVVDEVAFYDHALSPEQIQTHFRLGAGLTPLTPTFSASVSPTPTETRSPRPSLTGTNTPSDTPTRTWTRTPTMTSTPTPIPSATKSRTATNTATSTQTPQVVHVDLGATSGLPGESVALLASIHSSGLQVLATANDFSYRNDIFELDTNRCTIDPALGKKLVISVLPQGTATTTVRAFVQSNPSAMPIPDGLLYKCTVNIRPTADPGIYHFTSISTKAFGPGGISYPRVHGADAEFRVSLVQTCAGDCNEDSDVTIDELVSGINIGLGDGDVTGCIAADVNRDGDVTIDELLAGTSSALQGCAGS